ncbi:hypothetical protein LTR37_007169 [Vermiconidia calcicola]|uniref:Uncharacterized protein n=1 Tax=Vermiconidia calcicola TaxID=1690605 RepID=A0ACC3NEC7_9PEZI|nr:hypothetical protein LTR37_007169 [Vermiconidia calcicola]
MLKLLRRVVIAVLILSLVDNARSDDNGASSSSSSSNTTVSGRSVRPPGQSNISSALSVTTTLGNGTCPSRTANYITHTLPQQCLRTDRATANTTQNNTTNGSPNAIATTISLSQTGSQEDDSKPPERTTVPSAGSSDSAASPEPSENQASTTPTGTSGSSATTASTVSPESEAETDSPLDNANFLSFEEWKKQNHVKSSDQNRDLRIGGDRQRPGINALDALGDEGEIELDFSGFGGPASGPSQHQAAYRGTEGAASGQDAPKSQTSRSKDAGKTCKERTNYASFDCAATMLKNNPECKSASSVLVENKDSYMLNICSAQNKFFIVELCNDILIDTVVLANYEFFSSIFRHFRVSVSDRYPVKIDKWRELGTFEARNTRDVQAFLIEHPQIWARYVRIEFLTHYGSEYYCPVSLLRVHGTTMLEEIRPQEEAAHGEGSEKEVAPEAEVTAMPPIAQEPTASTDETAKETVQAMPSVENTPSEHTLDSSDGNVTVTSTTPGPTSLSQSDAVSSGANQNAPVEVPHLDVAKAGETCTPNTTTTVSETISRASDTVQYSSDQPVESFHRLDEEVQPIPNNQAKASSGSATSATTNSTTQVSSTGAAQKDEHTSNTTTTVKLTEGALNSTQALNDAVTSSIAASQSANATNSTRVATSTASASAPAQPQPSTQESFFKSIHKRLQQLESNSTLSLQYIEEQSRILRDAFSKVEKRQISATSSFLTNLNDTVMNELHGFRQAYDQLWQSTVIELEGQREQYQREMLALSTRLTLVADELVWQKRMGIVQSTLLLLCLGLVLFARAGNTGHLEVPLVQQMMNKSSAALHRAGWESPPISPSPENRSPVAMFRRKLWRSVTDPLSGPGTDATDSRPETREGQHRENTSLDVNIEPPTPPSENSNQFKVASDATSAGLADDDADDEDEEVLDPRESQSSPGTPRGTREREGTAPELIDGDYIQSGG